MTIAETRSQSALEEMASNTIAAIVASKLTPPDSRSMTHRILGEPPTTVKISAKFKTVEKALVAKIAINNGPLKELIEADEISVLPVLDDGTLPIECDSKYKQLVEDTMLGLGAKLV